MNGRALSFVVTVSLVMMVGLLLQNAFRPPAPQADVAQQALDGKSQLPDESTADSPPAEKTGSESKLATGQQPDDAGKTLENQTDSQSDPSATDSAKDQQKVNNAAADDVPPLARNPADRFLTLGSLAADSSDRFLITVNQRGGTIHRVELNYRQKKRKRLKYRDLENNGGYLGCLDCLDTLAGCVVRTVGNGTPAQMAVAPNVVGGIAVGDILVALNGEPILSADEFETRLEKNTKPRTTVQLSVTRGDQPLIFDVKLIEKPIELLRPEVSRLDPGHEYPESFVFSLLQPLEVLDQAWPDLDRNMRSSEWKIVSETGDQQKLELKYELPANQLEKHGISGPLTVLKRYRLPDLAAEDIYNLNSRTFHFELDIEITNGSDQLQKIAYELDGPTGSTTETWWYANKIHGRSTALGYVAGARDVIGSTERQPFVFIGCPEIATGATQSPTKVNFVSNPLIDNAANRNLNYVGVDTQYFNVTLIPKKQDDEKFPVDSVSAFPNGGKLAAKDVKLQKLVDCTFQMVKTVEINPGETYQQTFEIFSGPKEGKLLQHYGLDDARTFGWFAWCSKPLMSLLHFFYWITGSFSYGLAIIMLTVLVRCCMIPISRKAALNAQMMQHLQPQMKEIADKYKDDMEKRGIAQRELFKRNNYNPLSGCFMMFFQLPIFIGLYRGLSVDIALRDQPLIPGMGWCSNLSGPDQLLNWESWMPAMLANETGWLGPYLNILPLVTMVLFLLQQKLFMPPATDDQQKMMQKMMTFMMIFMGVMFFKVSAGLCLYFITSSLWGIIERKMLPKPVLNTDKLAIAGGTVAVGALAGQPISKAEQKAELKRETDLADRKQRNIERKKRLRERGV